MAFFEELENLLLKHKAKLKGIEGEIILTDLRIMFIPSEKSLEEPRSFVWANISNVKYSPANDPKGRAMILLKTVVTQYEDVTIQLIGSTVESHMKELEKMKTIISQIRKQSKSDPNQQQNNNKLNTNNTNNNKTNSNKRSSQLILNKTSETIQLNETKKRLLETDYQLAKQYHDLVESSQVISAEDFWLSHSPLLAKGDKITDKKGRVNCLLAGIVGKSAEGKTVVNLTVEKKENIFLLQPEVRRAFDAEVPVIIMPSSGFTFFFCFYSIFHFFNTPHPPFHRILKTN
jgi:hypothetical protein